MREFARRAESALRSRVAWWIGALLGVAVFALLVQRLNSLWQEHPVELNRSAWPDAVLGVALFAVATTGVAVAWAGCLRAVGAPVPRQLVAIAYLGQLGKYLPGGAMHLVGRAALATRHGVPLRLAGASLVVESVAHLASAVLVAPLALAYWPHLAAPAVIAVIALTSSVAVAVTRGPLRRALAGALRRLAGAECAVEPAELRRPMIILVCCWPVFGASVWLLARGVADAGAGDLLLLVGAWTVAWAAGYVVVFAPGGIGVREAVLVALIAPQVGEAEAIVVAAATRIASLLVDAAGGALAAIALSRGRAVRPAHRVIWREPPSPGPGPKPDRQA